MKNINRVLATLGEKNHFWKGEKAKIKSIKEYLYLHLPRPHICPVCSIRNPNTLFFHPINGNTRDFSNWVWICRKCYCNVNKSEKYLDEENIRLWKTYDNKIKKAQEYYKKHKRKIRNWNKKYREENKEALKIKRKIRNKRLIVLPYLARKTKNLNTLHSLDN